MTSALRDLIETFDRDTRVIQGWDETAPGALLSPADGMPARRLLERHYGAEYEERIAEAAEFLGDVYRGRRPVYQLREALSVGDFPLLFADVIDRQLLAAYQAPAFRWQAYTRQATVSDFRTVKRFRIDGGDDILNAIGAGAPYPEADLDEVEFNYAVAKYGRDIPVFFETLINDDLQAFQDLPARLARAVQLSEARFLTALYIDASGPHASFYTAGNLNIVPTNPVLTATALGDAIELMAAQRNPKTSEPIMVRPSVLVVPPALEVTALSIVRSQLLIGQGASAGVVPALNILPEYQLDVVVDPYIPVIASTANGNTSWFLFSAPSVGGAALELGVLRGHENPELMVSVAAFQSVGGGADVMGLDARDSRTYRVRKVFGGTRLDPRMTVGSNGSGS